MDPTLHGLNGPIHTIGGERIYPLRTTVLAMLTEVGVPFNGDANSGNPFGFAEYTENWYNGARQPAGQAYGLSGVTVLTDSPVRRVLVG